MSIGNGRIPLKISSAQFVTADPIAVMGFVLTNSGAAAVGQATIQDGHNNDICALNTTATNGVAQKFYPIPIPMSGPFRSFALWFSNTAVVGKISKDRVGKSLHVFSAALIPKRRPVLRTVNN